MAPEKPTEKVPDVEEMKHRSGRQQDDNIDDLGRDSDGGPDPERHPQSDKGKKA